MFLSAETELLRNDINLIKDALKLTGASPGSYVVPKPQENVNSHPEKQEAVVDDEDDIDLFGSDVCLLFNYFVFLNVFL